MENVIMEVNAQKANIKVFQDKIKISRKAKGLFGGIPNEKVILYKDISSINFVPVLKWRTVFGFIQFVVKGGYNRQYTGNPREYSEIDSDEYAITFNSKENATFEELKNMIEDRLSSVPETSTTLIQNQSSNLDEIEKLANLRDKGIITQEEFEAKKKQLLDL